MFFLLILLVAAFIVLPIIALVIAVRSRRESQRLARQFQEIQARVRRLAEGIKAPPEEAPPEKVPLPEEKLAALKRVARPPEKEAPPPVIEPVPPPAEVAPPLRAEKVRRRSIEEIIGVRWLSIVGAIAVIIGVGFFLKYAFEQNWLGPEMRVLMGLAAGVALCILGYIYHRKAYGALAQGLCGAGIAILYLSVYAAYGFYDLVGTKVAFPAMALVTVAAVAQATIYNSVAIACLGILGGFLTPVLFRTGVDRQIALFSYIALLNAGIIGVSFFRRWHALNLLSLAGTIAIYFGWYNEFYEPFKLPATQSFLSLFFALFLFGSLLHNVIRKRPLGIIDFFLLIIPPVAFFAASYQILEQRIPAYLDLFALGMAGLYLGLGLAARVKKEVAREVLVVLFLISAGFLTLAVPLQFNGQWVTFCWLLEATALLWLGLIFASHEVRFASLALLGVAVFGLFTYKMWEVPARGIEQFNPILNERFLIFTVGIASLFSAAYAYRKKLAQVLEEERIMPAVFMVLASLLILWLGALENHDYFSKLLARPGLGWREIEMFDFASRVTLAGVWALLAASLLILGFLTGFFSVRILALIVLGAVNILLLAFGSKTPVPESFHLIINRRFLFCLMAVAAHFLGAHIWRAQSRTVSTGLIILAAILIIWVASVENFDYHQNLLTGVSIRGPQYEQLKYASRLNLVMIWAILAGIFTIIGLISKFPALRIFGLLLLASANIMLLVFGSKAPVPEFFRIILNRRLLASAVIIALNFLAAYLFKARRNLLLSRERVLPSVLVIVGAFLILWLGSVENLDYYNKWLVQPTLSLEQVTNLEHAAQVRLSVMWTCLAALYIIIGFSIKYPPIRIFALLILLVTVGKVFIVDLSVLKRFYRIISFLGLGAVLLILSSIYHKYRHRISRVMLGK